MRTWMPICLIAAVGILPGCKEESTVEGAGGGELTLIEPDDIEIMRGGTTKLEINIKRDDGLEGPVTVSFDGLPDGVEVVDVDQKITGNEATYTFHAKTDAQIVENKQAKVTVTGPGEPGSGVAMTFMITVTQQE